jgi:hypothetical protein
LSSGPVDRQTDRPSTQSIGSDLSGTTNLLGKTIRCYIAAS